MALKPGSPAQVNWSDPLLPYWAWTFREGGGLFFREDIKGLKNTAAVVGNPTWGAGDRGPALLLDRASAIIGHVASTTPGLTGKTGQSPHTILARVRQNVANGSGENGGIIQFGEVTDFNASIGLGVLTAGSGELCFLYNGFGETAQSTLTLPANEWHVIGYAQRGAADRTFWLDNKSALNTTSEPYTDAVNGGIVIGSSYANSSIQPDQFSGLIDWIYVWLRALTDAEVRAVIADPDRFFRKNPPVVVIAAPAAADGAMTCNVSMVLTGAGTLTGAGALTAALSLPLTVSGTLGGAGALSAALSLVLTGAGTLTGSGALSCAASLVLTATGTLLGAGAMASAVDLPLTATGTLTGAGALTADVSLVLTVTGSMDAGAMQADVSLPITVSGTLTGSGALAADAPLVLTIGATLTGDAAAASDVDLAMTVTGILSDASGSVGGGGSGVLPEWLRAHVKAPAVKEPFKSDKERAREKKKRLSRSAIAKAAAEDQRRAKREADDEEAILVILALLGSVE